MTVAPLTYIKLRMLMVWWERNRPDDETAPPDDAKIGALQGVLDAMGGGERWYYAQTLKAMSAFMDHRFDEARRPRERKPNFWSGTLNGVFVINAGGYTFGGQLRYRLRDALRTDAEDANPAQINQFINYMRTFETSRGNIAVHSFVRNALGKKIPLADWTELQIYFTPEEIIEVNNTPEWVDIPA